MRKLIFLGIFSMIALFTIKSATASDNKHIVLFDQGHNQRFLIEESGDLHLSKFAETFRAQDLLVTSTKKPLTDELLKEKSALVISGSFDSLKSEEIDAIIRFIEAGGHLAVMLHISSPLSDLLTKLDVDHSNVVLHERSNIIDADINFKVTNLSASPLFAGLNHFSTYGSWALNPGKNATPIAQTSSETWADLDGNKIISKGDVIGAFNVVVSGKLGAGSFVLFGDDAIFQNRYLDENNQRLAKNLALWMIQQ